MPNTMYDTEKTNVGVRVPSDVARNNPNVAFGDLQPGNPGTTAARTIQTDIANLANSIIQLESTIRGLEEKLLDIMSPQDDSTAIETDPPVDHENPGQVRSSLINSDAHVRQLIYRVRELIHRVQL